ncbi:hypothetical protein NIES4106_11770 [Fischerella sp. NIES-4106]|nr:hypothetical protein NIES4106_11770 [Fischerella sp. NIES-4106]
MEFEWNTDKVDRNLKKHSVSFQEAATVFADALLMQIAQRQRTQN